MKKILLLVVGCIFFYCSPLTSQSVYIPKGQEYIGKQPGFLSMQMAEREISDLYAIQTSVIGNSIVSATDSRSNFLLSTSFQKNGGLLLSCNLSGIPFRLIAISFYYPAFWISAIILIAISGLLFFLFKRYQKSGIREYHYKSLLDEAPTAMLIFQDYKLKYVNGATEKLTGYSARELLSMEIWELIHARSLKDLNSENWAPGKNGSGMRMEFQIKTKKGDVVWVDFSAQLIDYLNKPAFLATALLIDEKKHFEEKLIEAEERYSLIVLATNDGISDYNIENDSLYLSAQWKEMLGFEDNEVENKLEAWLDLIHPDDYSKALKMFKKIQIGEIPELEKEYRMRCKDGSFRWIQVKLSVVFDNNSKPVRVLGTHSDITQKKQTEEVLKESEHRYKSLFSQNTAVMMITNPDTGAIEDANAAACKYYGYSHHELTKMSVADINLLLEETGEEIQSPKDFQSFGTLYLRHRLKSGIVRHVEVYNSKIELHGRVLNHSIIYDITQRMAMEKELKEAKERAENAVKAKSDFVSVISHEIRTPLNAIIGLADLMVTEEDIPAGIEENIRSIKFSSDHLLSIINDVLDFSKLEAGKVEIDQTNFNLHKLIRDSINTVKFKAQEKDINLGMRLNPNVPLMVYSDASRLKQVFLNLLSNALKFTDDGHIDVYARMVESDNEKGIIRFAVSDTGIGIPEDKQQKIFESFSQAENHTFRKYGGTGLGLSICKKLVDLLGGKIGVKSIDGIGSTFWFEIPMQISNQHQGSDQPKTGGSKEDLSALKVLLVEDDSMNQFVMNKILRRWNIKSDVANNGEEAIRKLEKQDFHVVLMDLHMPVMDGYEATRIIRNGKALVLNPQVPIIALTGDTKKETRDNVVNAGMNDHISKPCEQNVLKQKLLKYCPESHSDLNSRDKAPNVSYDKEKIKSQIKKALWDIFDEDITATRSMISHFIKQVPESIEYARSSLSAQKPEAASKSLHKVKPGFSYLGFSEVSELVEQLQQDIRSNKDNNLISVNLVKLEKHIKRIIDLLHEVYAELEPNDPAFPA